MDMREIEVVCELENYKNFADAAYSLAYSPSVITKYVSNIEKELGVQIYYRSTKSSSMAVTPDGVTLLKALQRIVSDYHYLTELASQLNSVHVHPLRIGSQARLGSLPEQEIVAAYLADHLDVSLSSVKAHTEDLISMMKTGKLDGLFLTIHKDYRIEAYCQEQFMDESVKVIHIAFNPDMYLAVDERYLPGQTEAPFRAFRDFVFAFPFVGSVDKSDVMALSSFRNLARENGFELKQMFSESLDNSVFRLARMRPVAVSCTNTNVKHDGIKYVKVNDWNGGVNTYFLYTTNNEKKTLKDLLFYVNDYVRKQHAAV